MKAQELRIGNLVNGLSGKTILVETIGEYGINASLAGGDSGAWIEHEATFEGLQPIPLNEEWLQKFGFENKGLFENKIYLPNGRGGDMDGATQFVLGQYKHIVYLLAGKFYYQLASCTDDYGDNIETVELPYVHELQNLHYALKREELTIK